MINDPAILDELFSEADAALKDATDYNKSEWERGQRAIITLQIIRLALAREAIRTTRAHPKSPHWQRLVEVLKDG